MPADCFVITTNWYPFGWNFVYGWNFYADGVVFGDFNGDGKGDYINLRGSRYAHQFLSMPDPLPTLNKAVDLWTTPVYTYRSGLPSFSGQYALNSQATLTADFNGDGKTDYARLTDKKAYFFISKGDGTFWQPVLNFPLGTDYGFNENSWTTFPAVDINADGRFDFIRASSRYLHAWIVTGADSECFLINKDMPDDKCFKMVTYHFPGSLDFSGAWTWNHPAARVGDFNGDGKADFVRLGPTFAYFFIGKGNGDFWTPVFKYPNGLDFGTNEYYWTTLKPADYDGNGKTDIIRAYWTYHYGFFSMGGSSCWELNGDTMAADCIMVNKFDYKAMSFSGAWSWQSGAVVVGDFNGDSKMDFGHLGNVMIRLFISKGNGQFYQPIVAVPDGWDFSFDEGYFTTLRAMDYDGDGRSDIIRSHRIYHHAFWFRGSNERCFNFDDEWPEHRPWDCYQITTYYHPQWWDFNGIWAWYNYMSVLHGDFNGDGRADYINVGGSNYCHMFLSEDD